MSRKLLNHPDLERSPVVANSRMNRERGAVGTNSYEKEIKLNPIEFLACQHQTAGEAAWLDLCCGTGRALIETSRILRERNITQNVAIHGVDLVDMFDPAAPADDMLTFETASLHVWEPNKKYDLITCVHGLHYVGDKLALLQRAVLWLQPAGVLLANLDMNNFRSAEGAPLGQTVAKRLREQGVAFDSRSHLLKCQGPKTLELRLRYVGANDAAGPNYSGQEVVDSIYELAEVDPEITTH